MFNFLKKIFGPDSCKEREIKLGFLPSEGASSGYFNCLAVASDGSRWTSMGGKWLKRVLPAEA